MKPSEKQAYLEEYELLKKKGKPFFPYAVLKDSAMALIVVGVIIAMSLILGAEQGPKADPTSTTYVPRPEWYFFFLFEVLRVIKPPELVPIATIGIPTVCMVLLLLLPFYDRNPERRPERRPIATIAGILTILAMGYLTYEGAVAGPPTEVSMKVAKQFEAGKEVVAGAGCLACHKLGENGNNGPGPELTHIGARIPRAAILRSVEIGPGIMPSFRELLTTFFAFQTLGAKFANVDDPSALLAALQTVVPKMLNLVRQIISTMDGAMFPFTESGMPVALNDYLLPKPLPQMPSVSVESTDANNLKGTALKMASDASDCIAPYVDAFLELYHRAFGWLCEAAERVEIHFLGPLTMGSNTEVLLPEEFTTQKIGMKKGNPNEITAWRQGQQKATA